jgi:hypothetical protein
MVGIFMNECADEGANGFTLIIKYAYLFMFANIFPIIRFLGLNDTELGDSLLLRLTDNLNTIFKTELGKVPTFLVG